MDQLCPLTAHTCGLEQTIADALDADAARVYVGLGGSATTDGGLGAPSALGAHFESTDGTALSGGNAQLGILGETDLDGLRPLPARGVVLLTDIRSPLVGPRGAAPRCEHIADEFAIPPFQVGKMWANRPNEADQAA